MFVGNTYKPQQKKEEIMLKGINPQDVKPSKVKFLMSGPPGSGKSWLSLEFPKPYIIDTEGGIVRRQYQDKLKKVGGSYFGQEQGSEDFQAVINEVKTLATTKHPYLTLVIDSFSHLYLLEAAAAEEKIGSDFGKDRKFANKATRQLLRWINKCDLNVILTAHVKAKWARKGDQIFQDGNTFEGNPKMEHDLDLFIEILPGYKNFIIKKSRVESLPQGETMPLSYKNFAEIYGEEILSAESKPIEMATESHINKIKSLIEALNISEEQIAKWFKKCDTESFEEMTNKQITGLIDFLDKKIQLIQKDKK